MQGLIGKKLGMTQVFDEQGHQVPVTVLSVGPCVVVQRKSTETDGYEAVQLGFMDQKEHRVTKPQQGHFKKNGVSAKKILREVRLEEGDEVKVGDTLKAGDVFTEGVTHVDVIGVTKGRGFQGVMRRHNMHGGRASHGAMSHRRIGAIGQCATPSRVFKNKKMPGQMGHTQVTAQNLKVVEVRGDDDMILVRGSVPGPTGSIVFVRKALKKPAKAS
jgi:large subunit ribosomal protein L3